MSRVVKHGSRKPLSLASGAPARHGVPLTNKGDHLAQADKGNAGTRIFASTSYGNSLLPGPDDEDREDGPQNLRNARRSPVRCVRLHRAVPQSAASAFDARAGRSGSVRKGYKRLRVVSGNSGEAQKQAAIIALCFRVPLGSPIRFSFAG